MNFCCPYGLLERIKLIKQKEKKSGLALKSDLWKKKCCHPSLLRNYSALRGSVGHIATLAFFGLDERTHILNTKLKYSLARTINRLVAPVSLKT